MHVLHELNWTKLVYEPLHKFETQIISTKNLQGYDSKNAEQWSLTGALLYSVTVITTIGKAYNAKPLHTIIVGLDFLITKYVLKNYVMKNKQSKEMHLTKKNNLKIKCIK